MSRRKLTAATGKPDGNEWIRKCLTVFIVVMTIFGITILMIRMDFFDRFYEFSRSHEDLELDEIFLGVFVTLVVISVALCIGTIRHNRELTRSNKLLEETMSVLREQSRFQAEAQRLMSERERLSAIGTIAGGFAHNFNNLLLPILGLSQSARDDLPPESDTRKDIEIVIEAATQAKALVDTVLSQARTPEQGDIVKDIGSAIASAAALARAGLPQSITLDIVRNDAVDSIQMAASPLEAALLNLIANARDAYGGNRGRIILKTSLDTFRAPRIVNGSLLAPGLYLNVSVTDNAGGMAPEVMAMAFAPFFTTKAAGVGTGLGLHSVMGFATRHGGSVDLVSEPGIGTRVDILLPMTPDGRLASATPVSEAV